MRTPSFHRIKNFCCVLPKFGGFSRVINDHRITNYSNVNWLALEIVSFVFFRQPAKAFSKSPCSEWKCLSPPRSQTLNCLSSTRISMFSSLSSISTIWMTWISLEFRANSPRSSLHSCPLSIFCPSFARSISRSRRSLCPSCPGLSSASFASRKRRATCRWIF